MSFLPPGFNGAISPKLNVCVSQDCQNITFSDVTLLSSPANPFGWTTDSSETPRPRILTAFSEIRVIVKNSSNQEVINLLVYSPPNINFYPNISEFSNEIPLTTYTWGLPDGVYSFTYRFTYRSTGLSYGDPDNLLGLQGHYTESIYNQLITCNTKNAVKDLWLKYLNNCCGSNRDNALEAEALLYAVEAAAACADEFNASRIKESLDRIIALSSGKCNLCKSTKCKC
jgi:hypothetical protein